MYIKDYYQLLELPPQASLPEIKQAYRRLAMIYHPDKNNNNPDAVAQFNAIKEAYETLTDPLKKEKYLQQRWYNESIGKKKTQPVITPVNILKECLELEKYVSLLDAHRMNQEGLSQYIHELLNDETIEKLRSSADAGVNRQIISTVLAAMKPLPFSLARSLATRLEKLAGNDKPSLERINEFMQLHKRMHLWEKYKIVIIVLVTALICVLIFLTSK